MQQPVTPKPGQTPTRWVEPKGNIVDREDYKLDFQVKEFRPQEFVVTIEKFIPEHGWIAQQFFLDENELDRIKAALNGTNKP